MAIYSFETITPADALAIGGTDTVSVAVGTGTAVGSTVAYAFDAAGHTTTVSVTLGSQTVVFGPSITSTSESNGRLSFADGSVLYVGNDANNFFYEESATHDTAAFGGSGDDRLVATGPHNLVQGNAGDDYVTSVGGSNTIYGGQGNDSIGATVGTNFIQGNKGEDQLVGGGRDTILGGQGNDIIHATGSTNFLNGNLGDDTLSANGSGSQSLIFGEDGNDSLYLNSAGGSSMDGGSGNDTLTCFASGTDADTLTGGSGADSIFLSGRNASISGGAGADRFSFGTSLSIAGGVSRIMDWSGSEDSLYFGSITFDPANLMTGTSTDYSSALSIANNFVTTTHFNIVEMQIGNDVYLFAGGPSGVTKVVELVGRGLADVGASNFL